MLLDCNSTGYGEILGGCYEFIPTIKYGNGAYGLCTADNAFAVNINSEDENAALLHQLPIWINRTGNLKFYRPSSCWRCQKRL